MGSPTRRSNRHLGAAHEHSFGRHDRDHRPRGRAGAARQRVRSDPGRVRPRPVAAAQQLGTLGRRCSRRPATRPSRRAGPTTPTRSQRPRSTPRCSPARPSARSPTTSQAVIERPDRKPVVIGHSFGGLLTQILAGRGLGAVSVAISPAPFRGVLPLPISALRSSKPVLGNPANRHRAIPLTFEQFRYASPTRSARTRPSSCTRTTPCPARASRSSRRPPPTSTRGPRPRSTPRTPTAGPLLIISGRPGPHRPVGDRQRVLQAPATQRGRDRDRQARGSRPRADDRPAAGRRSPRPR